MTREEFLSSNPIIPFLESRGHKVLANKIKCPFHADKTPSLSLNTKENTWYCHACKIGGSIIDFISREKGISIGDALKDCGITSNGHAVVQSKPSQAIEIEAIYKYQDQFGNIVYEVVRYKPKTFRQRHMVDGAWVWNMEGVTRFLYRLPEVLKSDKVWIVEGEKDADNLSRMGFCATTNVGGAEKWLDAYTASLEGKEVVICGDNDEPGRKHVEKVFESLAGKVRCAKLFTVPNTHKDISDFIASFTDSAKAKAEIEKVLEDAASFFKGVKVPIYSMAELENKYAQHVQRLSVHSLDLSKWLYPLKSVRPLVPGDLALIVGDTGVGKSNVLINIARAAKPLPTLFFEMELPAVSIYERFMAAHNNLPHWEVEKAYADNLERAGDAVLNHQFPGLYICEESGLTADALENHIIKAELKIGEKPKVVLLDYVQLLKGLGKRYERASDNAEQLKVIAKRCGIVLVIASQVHRPEGDEGIHLHSAKDSGSLENSAGLVIGVWRDGDDLKRMYLQVLKNTKGTSWREPICCDYLGDRSIIKTESIKIP